MITMQRKNQKVFNFTFYFIKIQASAGVDIVKEPEVLQSSAINYTCSCDRYKFMLNRISTWNISA